MRSTTTTQVSSTAREAAGSRPARWLARAGLTARGIVYILIGWVAILVAIGHTSQQADQQGALQLLASKPLGLVSLWLLGIGFAAYALWRASQAAFGVTGDRSSAVARLTALGGALAYAGLAYLTFKVISGSQPGSQTQRQEDITATAMHHPAGRWLVGVAGLVIVGVGVALIGYGVVRRFMKYLRTSQMSPGTRRVVRWLGTVGSVARGVVFALIGVLVIDAAVTHNPAKSGGVDQALLTLRGQPFGEFLVILAALGLIIFGVYGLCEARWRRV
jgi:hypothetical protein